MCQFCGQRVSAVVATAAVMRVSVCGQRVSTVVATASVMRVSVCGQRVSAVVATATAMSVSVLQTACHRCGGHSRRDVTAQCH